MERKKNNRMKKKKKKKKPQWYGPNEGNAYSQM